MVVSMTEPVAPSAAAADTEPAPDWLEQLTPRQIVTELDKYIVGQEQAKRPSP